MTEAATPPRAATRPPLAFTVGGVRFTCEVDEPLYGRQRQLLRSYLGDAAEPGDPPGGAGGDDVRVRVTVSDAEFDRLLPSRPTDRTHAAYVGAPYDVWQDGATQVHRYPAAAAGGRGDHLFVVGPGGIRVVVRAGVPGPERLLRHVLCDVLRSAWEDRGATMFHAACAAAGERVVLVVGPKGAGKTTTVTMLGGDGGLALCGNDRTLVVGDGGQALGLPMAYRLGHGQVHSEPALAGLLDCGPAGGGACDPARKHVLPPAELAAALGGRVGLGGRLGLVLLPRLSPDDRSFWSEPADRRAVADELAASCYTPDDPAYLEPRFRPRRTTRARRAATAAAACRRLAAAVPALRVGWGQQADLAAVRHELRRAVLSRIG